MKYRIWLIDGTSIIADKDDSGLFREVITLKRYGHSDITRCDILHDCADCSHLRTPKGKQCYTLSKMVKEKIRDKGLPLDPIILIPLLDSLGEKCKRYLEK